MADRPKQNEPMPLNAEEADRLAEQFHASWETEEEPQAAAGPAAPVPMQPAANVAPAAPGSLPVAPKVVGKQTLLGLAPVATPLPSPENASAAPIPAPATPPQVTPLPNAQSDQAGALPVNPNLQQGAAPIKRTLLGLAPVPDSPATATPVEPPAAVHQPPVELGRPYTPKDDPATPAVVLAEEVRVESTPKRPQLAQTIPSLQRVELPTKPEVEDDELEYPKPKTGKIALFAVLAAAVLGLGIVGVNALSSDGDSSPASAPSAPVNTPPKVATAEPPPPPAPEPDTEPARTESERETKGEKAKAEVAARGTTSAAEASDSKATTRVKRTPLTPPTKQPVRRTSTSGSKSSGDTQSAPTKPKAGVIVRDTPF